MTDGPITGGLARSDERFDAELQVQLYEGDTAHVWVADDKARTLAIRPIKPGRTRDDGREVAKHYRP